jgi:hypothetical protein
MTYPPVHLAGPATTLNEIHLAGAEVAEKDGFVIKEIMRTGEWPVIPTAAGQVKQPLKIVKRGKSDPDQGIISMEEIVTNFKAGAIPNPQVPLSDDFKDHKNLTRLNTGFVRDLWIQESPENDEDARLVSMIEFTEPDVMEKALRGTYADVSAGVPWSVRSRGQDFGACLEHVCITNKPFIDDLGPWLQASDSVLPEDTQILHFGALAPAAPLSPPPVATTSEPEVQVPEALREDEPPPAAPPPPTPAAESSPPPPAEEPPPVLSYETQRNLISAALVNQLHLPVGEYAVTDIVGQTATINHDNSKTSWTVPFQLSGLGITLPKTSDWPQGSKQESEEPSAAPVEAPPAPGAQMSDLEYARRLREIRLGQGTESKAKEAPMPLTREELDRLELSDEQRTAFSALLDENASLSRTAREKEVDRRVEELKGLGLEERPGALKLYRQVMLAEDGGPAAVLLSDDGEKEPITALQILDRFIEAITKDESVLLTDERLVNTHDPKPPVTPESEVKPFDERLAEAKRAIGQA